MKREDRCSVQVVWVFDPDGWRWQGVLIANFMVGHDRVLRLREAKLRSGPIWTALIENNAD
jgi:hypothetical protein